MLCLCVYDSLLGFLRAACEGMYTAGTVTFDVCVDFHLCLSRWDRSALQNVTFSVACTPKDPSRMCQHDVTSSVARSLLSLCRRLSSAACTVFFKLIRNVHLRCRAFICDVAEHETSVHFFLRWFFVLRVPASRAASLPCASSVKCALLWGGSL